MIQEPARKGVREYGPLALALLLAVALRMWGLQEQSLTMDEVAELNIAERAVRDIIWARDGFPPLFHLLLHGWLELFPGDGSARWLSLLLGSLAVLAIWPLAVRVGGLRTGHWTAFLLAMSPLHVWHSQEGRAYILYFLLTILALWFFARACETRRAADWIWYGVAGVAGLYTHYYFSLLLLVTVLILLVEGRWRDRRTIVVHAGMALLCVPLILLVRVDFALEGSVAYANPFQIAALGYTYFALLVGFSLGPSIRELHMMPAREAAVEALPWVLLIGAAAVVLAHQGLQAIGSRMWARRLAMLAVIPVLVLALISEALGVTFQVRHVLWVLIPLLLVFGAGLSRALDKPLVALAAAALLIVSAASLRNRHFLERYSNEDVRSLSAYLKSTSSPETPVLVMTGYMGRPVSRYLGDRWAVHEIPHVGADGEGLQRALQFIESSVPQGSAFWLVYTRPFHGDPAGRLRDALLDAGVIEPRTEFPGVVLYEGRESGMGTRDRVERPVPYSSWLAATAFATDVYGLWVGMVGSPITSESLNPRRS